MWLSPTMHWTLPFGIEPFSAEFLGLVVREKDGHECEFGYVVEWQTLKCDKQWKLRWQNIEIKLFSWTVFAIEDSKSRMIYDIRNNQGRGKCYQPTRRPRLITLTETLIIQDITKTELIILLLYIVLKKITTNTLSQGTLVDILIENHVLRAQPTH